MSGLSSAKHLLGIYQTRVWMAEKGTTHPKPYVLERMKQLVAALSALPPDEKISLETEEAGKARFRRASTGELLVEFGFAEDA